METAPKLNTKENEVKNHVGEEVSEDELPGAEALKAELDRLVEELIEEGLQKLNNIVIEEE